MSSLPIACSLTPADLAAVKERYQAAASQFRATARISDNHADITLTGDATQIRELLTEMIERESTCCPFLTFETAESDDGVVVRLSVLDGSGLERGILRESVEAFFPAATLLA